MEVEILNINDLRPAQHIYYYETFHRLRYKAHGIVMSVDADAMTFDIMHYVWPRTFERRRIVREKISFTEYSPYGIFQINYDAGQHLPDEEVLKRAERCIGKKGFNICTRRSIHVALYCKIGPKPVVRYESSAGDLYEHPRFKVHSVKELEMGDHIVLVKKLGFYEHHAIVKKVEGSEVTIIHFHPVRKIPLSIRVDEEKKDFNELYSDMCFKVQYNEGETKLSPEEVVTTAQKLYERGKEEPCKTEGYNIFTNNCEHFATGCKTEIKFSEQVKTTVSGSAKFGVCVSAGLARGAAGAFDIILDALDDILYAVAKGVSKTFQIIAPILTALIEYILALYKTYKAKKLFREGKINIETLKVKVKTYWSSAGLSVYGSFIGLIIGLVAGGPVLALVLSIVGGLVAGRIPQIIASIKNIVEQRSTVFGPEPEDESHADLMRDADKCEPSVDVSVEELLVKLVEVGVDNPGVDFDIRDTKLIEEIEACGNPEISWEKEWVFVDKVTEGEFSCSRLNMLRPDF